MTETGKSSDTTAADEQLDSLIPDVSDTLLGQLVDAGSEPFVDRVNQGAFAELPPAADSDVERVFAQIVARAPEHKVQPSLERVEMALDYLGNPQTTYRVAHIAGTNGKTTTARMIDALATAQGLRTGRFTSPHLISPTERIAIAGEPLSAAGFLAAYDDVKDIVELVDERNPVRLSFFELLTVMAYAAFAEAPVDLAVMETGMGGRWDATNVVVPEVAVITPISRDHTQWLGNTIAEIAAEKAGIIKPGGQVIVGPQPEEALGVIEARAREVGADLRIYGRDFKVLRRQQAVGGQVITLQTPAGIYEDIFLPLFGEHQAENAAGALAAYEILQGGRAVDANIVEDAFAHVTSPGRCQVVRRSPLVLVDAAHNPGGAHVLARTLEKELQFKHITGVYSAMADKEHEAVLAELEPVLSDIVLVQMPGERAASLETLTDVAIDVFGADRVHTAADLLDAVDQAVALAEANSDTDPLVTNATVIFGSVKLVGDALHLLGEQKTNRD